MRPKTIFTTMNKSFLILLVLLVYGCDKSDPLEVNVDHQHGEIDFTFADSIAGTYVGDRILNSSPIHADTSQITVQVIDLRTKYECKFYIDYIDDTVYLVRNGWFETKWDDTQNSSHQGFTHKNYFKNNQLVLERLFYSDVVDYPILRFKGDRVN